MAIYNMILFFWQPDSNIFPGHLVLVSTSLMSQYLRGPLKLTAFLISFRCQACLASASPVFGGSFIFLAAKIPIILNPHPLNPVIEMESHKVFESI